MNDNAGGRGQPVTQGHYGPPVGGRGDAFMMNPAGGANSDTGRFQNAPVGPARGFVAFNRHGENPDFGAGAVAAEMNRRTGYASNDRGGLSLGGGLADSGFGSSGRGGFTSHTGSERDDHSTRGFARSDYTGQQTNRNASNNSGGGGRGGYRRGGGIFNAGFGRRGKGAIHTDMTVPPPQQTLQLPGVPQVRPDIMRPLPQQTTPQAEPPIEVPSLPERQPQHQTTVVPEPDWAEWTVPKSRVEKKPEGAQPEPEKTVVVSVQPEEVVVEPRKGDEPAEGPAEEIVVPSSAPVIDDLPAEQASRVLQYSKDQMLEHRTNLSPSRLGAVQPNGKGTIASQKPTAVISSQNGAVELEGLAQPSDVQKIADRITEEDLSRLAALFRKSAENLTAVAEVHAAIADLFAGEKQR